MKVLVLLLALTSCATKKEVTKAVVSKPTISKQQTRRNSQIICVKEIIISVVDAEKAGRVCKDIYSKSN
jgi:hypothetical protein